MEFATLDWNALPKHGTSISWTFWPGTKGETLTTIRGCKWAKYFDAAKQVWVYYDTCAGCYAQNTAHSLCVRFGSKHYEGLTKATSRGPIWNGKVRFDEEQLLAVLSAKKARTYFLTSMGDLFYEEVSDEIIAYHIAVFILAYWHRVLILTKRPDRMARLLASDDFRSLVIAALMRLCNGNERYRKLFETAGHAVGHQHGGPKLPPNMWFGTSIENRASAKWALSELSKVPAPGHRWISFEPMIEYADISEWLVPVKGGPVLSWVVLGGASRQGAAKPWPFNMDDALEVIRVCKVFRIPVFVKQLGANPTMDDHGVSVVMPAHDNHNADPKHWPEYIRIQQFPVPA